MSEMEFTDSRWEVENDHVRDLSAESVAAWPTVDLALWLRRLVVMAPALAVVAAGMDITRALVLSQVVLSLVLPTPMVALVRFTASREVMGEFANSRLINALAIAATGFVSLLNGILLLAIAGLPIPFAGA